MLGLIDWLARSIWTTLAAVVAFAALGVTVGRAFEMTVGGALALYFIVWWLVLFAILPVRIRTQSDLGEVVPGTEPGAPASPALRERAIWTSIVSTVVFAGVAALFPLAGL